MVKRKTITRNCKNCTREFRTNTKNIEYSKFEYCSVCRKQHKNCEICGKEIFVQARTCSKECAYELRKLSWKESCGSEHNFSKQSSSRKKWENQLKEKEGINNVFQRESVKKKIKSTWLDKYGVDNPSKSDIIKNIKSESYAITRKKNQELGIWIRIEDLSAFHQYSYNVWQITNNQIKKYGDIIQISMKNENKNINKWKDKWSIDHKFSIKEGFIKKISPEIIGSIINLEIITISENSRKNSKCSITLEKLIKDYNNFINENKIN